MLSVDLPRIARIRQRFGAERITDVKRAVGDALAASGVRERIAPGARIAVTAGSRGINHIEDTLAACVGTLRAFGAEPFIVPAMGSHGGATAAGQTEVLAGYGITEKRVGAPIRATMDVVEVGRTVKGVP